MAGTAFAVPAIAGWVHATGETHFHTSGMATVDGAALVDCDAGGVTPAHSSFTSPLAIPPKVDRRNRTTPVQLVMKSGWHRFSPDLPSTRTFGYALDATATDVYGGPTIEARKGVPLRVEVVNALGDHPLAGVIDTTVMGTEYTDASAPRGTVHLHGAHSEPQYDGLPDSTFAVGEADTYVYGNDQDATGLWYHDHSWGITRLQVVAGLTGQLWLRDKWDTGDTDNPLHLPAGRYEVPLTFQDRTFAADGSFAYPVGPHCGLEGLPAGHPNQWSPESFGDVATVNGVIEPNLTVSRAVYRFRMLNGSNARFYDFTLVQVDASGNPTGVRASMHQIGSDGGLLDAPVAVDELLMAPGERADVLIDFRSLPVGSSWRLLNDALAPYPDGGDGDLPQVMQFTVGRHTGPTTGVPTTLRGGKNRPPRLPAVAGVDDAATKGSLHATTSRTIFLNEIVNDDTLGAGVDGEPVHVMMGNQFYADDATMTPRTQQVESPSVNTVEEWVIVNTTGDAHPVHLHLTQFRVLSRQALAVDPESGETVYLTEALAGTGLPFPAAAGNGPWPAPSASPYVEGDPWAPAANEAGWKDTVIALPNTVTRIVVPFGGTAAGIPAPYVGDKVGATVQRFTGNYVFHCHILEHEDNDMMSPLVVQR
ncbi:MAG: hypothetical protein RL238_1278 [Actinomycetota bacterium]|jgi:spore coat protein A, manganese oxidase